MTSTRLNPHTYAVAAQFVAAHAATIPGLYVSVSPYGIDVLGDPRTPQQVQLEAFRLIASRLGAEVLPDGDRFRFQADYDGVPVSGVLFDWAPDTGRTDEVHAAAPVVLGGAA